MTNVSSRHTGYPLLWAHHLDAEVWEAECTLVPAGRFPGAPVANADNQGSALWSPRGDYEGAPATFHLKAQRGGFADSGCEYAWSTDGSVYYGWDYPAHVTDVRPVQMDAVVAFGSCDLVATADSATLVLVTDDLQAAGTSTPTLYTRTTTGEWDSQGPLTSLLTAPENSGYPAYFAAWPTLVRMPDGSIRMFVWRHFAITGSTYVSVIDSYAAPADADWTSQPFERYSAGAYTGPDGAAGPRRTRAACIGSQITVLALSAAGVDPPHYQLVSSDGGATFVAVNLELDLDGATDFDLVALGGDRGLLLVYTSPSGDDIYCRKVGSGRVNFGNATTVTIATGLTSCGVPAVAVDDDGTVYVYAFDGTDLNVYRSLDGGSTWVVVNKIADVAGSTTDLEAVAWRGRVVLATVTDDANVGATDFSGGLATIELGGWTTLGMPPFFAGWSRFTPVALLPGVMGVGSSWSPTNTGSPTRSIDGATASEQIAAGAGTARSYALGLASGYQDVMMRVVSEVTAGTSDARLLSATLRVGVAQTATQLTITDHAAGGATIGTVLGLSGMVDWILRLDEVANKVYLWWRLADDATDARTYTLALDGVALSTGSYTPEAWVQATDSSTRRIKILQAAGSYPVLSWRTSGVALPPGRPSSALPTWTTNAIRMAHVAGSALPGDLWSCSPTSLTGLDQAAATADNRSPRARLETVDATPGYMAWKLAAATATVDSELWGVWLSTNAKRVRLDWHDGSNWVTGPVVKVELTGEVLGVGARLQLASSGNATGGPPFFFEMDELAGGWIEGTSPVLGPVDVVRNEPGHSNGSRKPVCTMAAAGLDTADAVHVVLPRAVAVLDSSLVPASAKGVRLYLYDDPPPSGAYYLKACVGPVRVLHPQSRSTVHSTQPQREVVEGESGTRSMRRSGPTIETIDVTWQQDLYPWRYQTHVDSAPDHVQDAAGATVWQAGEDPTTLAGIVDRHYADGVPVVFVPWWTIGLPAAIYELGRTNGARLCTIETPWTVEHAGYGDEQYNDTLRLGMMQLRTIP